MCSSPKVSAPPPPPPPPPAPAAPMLSPEANATGSASAKNKQATGRSNLRIDLASTNSGVSGTGLGIPK